MVRRKKDGRPSAAQYCNNILHWLIQPASICLDGVKLRAANAALLSVISIISIFVMSNIRPEQCVPLVPPPLAHVEDRCPLDSLAEKQLGSLTVTTALPLSASAAKDSVTSVLVRLGCCQPPCTNCSSLNAPSASGKQGETGWRNRCCLLANVET